MIMRNNHDNSQTGGNSSVGIVLGPNCYLLHSLGPSMTITQPRTVFPVKWAQIQINTQKHIRPIFDLVGFLFSLLVKIVK